MGLFDRFMDVLHESDDDDFDDFYDEDENSYGITPPAGHRQEERRARDVRVPREEKTEKVKRSKSDSDKIMNIHATAQLQVVLAHPKSVEEGQGIVDDLRDNKAVVVNFENASRDVANCMRNFLLGATYALKGDVKKITNDTIILTPYCVDVVSDLVDTLRDENVFL